MLTHRAIQAAILIEKFKAFVDYELEAVNHVANIYTRELKDFVKTPVIPEGYYSSWAQYSIQLESEEQRDKLMKHLKQKGIPSMIYYPKPMSMQTAFKELGYGVGETEVAHGICKTVLALPIHPYLKEEEILMVCEEVKEVV